MTCSWSWSALACASFWQFLEISVYTSAIYSGSWLPSSHCNRCSNRIARAALALLEFRIERRCEIQFSSPREQLSSVSWKSHPNSIMELRVFRISALKHRKSSLLHHIAWMSCSSKSLMWGISKTSTQAAKETDRILFFRVILCARCLLVLDVFCCSKFCFMEPIFMNDTTKGYFWRISNLYYVWRSLRGSWSVWNLS